MKIFKNKTLYASISVHFDMKCIAFFLLSFIVFFSNVNIAHAEYATTTIWVSICGNAIVDGTEACDDGAALNDGIYSSSTIGRHCSPNCRTFGPYCGDSILQAYYVEECDDGNNVSGDRCTSLCKQEETPISSTTPPSPPPTPSGDGGGTGGAVPIRAQTQVMLEGRAYPNSRVQILKDGQLIGMAQSDASAKFSYVYSNATPGPTTFGFWSEDAKQIRSITYTTTFQVTQNAVTNVGNVYLPPTIRALVKRIAPGSLLSIDGTTVPNSQVSVLIDKSKTPALSATSSNIGSWDMKLPTSGLLPEIYHQILPFFELSQGAGNVRLKSGTGLALNIFVGNNEATDRSLGPDLNRDGKVNLTDFSMLLFRWNGNDSLADLNRDGKVGIADFSILLFNWTG
jgi:cysteine-rich repeat protein